jgi:hypothetical protein
MPRLLLFAPCEKLIINQADNTTSLITLLETVNLPIPLGDEDKVPEDANAAFSWHIIALWQSTGEEDTQKEWEQRFVLGLPDGQETKLSGVMPIRFTKEKPNFRNVINILGFPLKPVLDADSCILKLYLRDKEREDWSFIADFRMLIRRQAKKEPNAAE